MKPWVTVLRVKSLILLQNILIIQFLMVSGQLPLRKIAPRLVLQLGLGLILELGCNFPRGKLS